MILQKTIERVYKWSVALSDRHFRGKCSYANTIEINLLAKECHKKGFGHKILVVRWFRTIR